MTSELKEYIESLDLQVYRMIDGSIILAEEQHRDIVDEYVILRRPLQITSIYVENSLKSAYVPWLPGDGTHVRINTSSIIAETDANFEQKFAYSRYYLVSHLQKYLSPTEFDNVLNTGIAHPSDASEVKDLKAKLNKGKRFHLN